VTGCGASVEQFATTDQGCFITAVISVADKGSSLSAVVQLTESLLLLITADH